MGLRSLKNADFGYDKPSIFARHNTLILVKKDGSGAFAVNSGDKRELIGRYDEDAGDSLIFIWSGKWSSDAFLVDQEDLEAFA